MIVYGFAKQYKYTSEGTLLIQTRIPSIHGPFYRSDYDGKSIKRYTLDEDLPWIQSILLPHLPMDGEVVAITSVDSTANNWLIIGLTGGHYSSYLSNTMG